MPLVVKRSTRQALEAGQSRRDVPLPQFVSPQLFLVSREAPVGVAMNPD
jgi:hypothetical protein